MSRERGLLAGSAVVLVASSIAIGILPEPHTRIPAFLLLYGAAFVAYLLAVGTVLRAKAVVAPAVVLVVCALAHLAMIPARPDLSPDIYRYAWEGRVFLHGHNPFLLAPDDSALVHLRDADFARVTHKDMATIYPPLAQGVFALAALIHPGPTMLKVFFSLFNLGTVLVLFRLLRRRGRPPAHALIFAWNPLVLVETGHSGHVDAMAAFFLVLALDLWESDRRVWSGVVMGASALVKYLAAAALPWLARRRLLAIAVVVVLVVVAGYVPFWSAGVHLFSSLRAYAGNWWFNGPPYLALSGFLGNQDLARRLLLAGGIAFTMAAAYRERDLARYLFLVIGCVLLVSPTVYPWYMMSIMPLVALFPHRAWIAFSALVMLSYGVWRVYNVSGVWVLPTWLMALEYVPFYVLLLVGLAGATRRARANA